MPNTLSDHSIVITAALRTLIGKFQGSLARIAAAQLGGIVIEALLHQNNLNATDLDSIIMGQVLTAGNGQNPARQAAVHAHVPFEVPAYSLNQVCGSGLQAIISGCRSLLPHDSAGIKTERREIIIAGGQESMSLVPHAAYLRNGCKFGNVRFQDLMQYDGLSDAFSKAAMGTTADLIASTFDISRDDQDEFALESQRKAALAIKNNLFNDETVPIKADNITLQQDESVRPDTTKEKLRRLKAVFNPEGTVTAGNSSTISDGAAGVVLMTMRQARKLGLQPLAVIRSFAQAGVNPDLMGTAPVPASRSALRAAGWDLDELTLIECNEAFAAQTLYVSREMGWDPAKLNVNGGAIALGHPIGASGARILVTLIHGLNKRGGGKGLATLCIGGGMGLAICVESLSTW